MTLTVLARHGRGRPEKTGRGREKGREESIRPEDGRNSQAQGYEEGKDLKDDHGGVEAAHEDGGDEARVSWEEVSEAEGADVDARAAHGKQHEACDVCMLPEAAERKEGAADGHCSAESQPTGFGPQRINQDALVLGGSWVLRRRVRSTLLLLLTLLFSTPAPQSVMRVPLLRVSPKTKINGKRVPPPPRMPCGSVDNPEAEIPAVKTQIRCMRWA